MALRKARYIAEHDEPAEMELEGEIREFVSRDVVSNVGRRPENETELVASNINSVLLGDRNLGAGDRCAHLGVRVVARHAAQRGRKGSARDRSIFNLDSRGPAFD